MFLALMNAALAAPPSDLCPPLDQAPVVLSEVARPLREGADPDARCPRTSLAHKERRVSELERLLDAGGDPDAPEPFGRRPLHPVLEHEPRDALQLALVYRLLQAGADPSLAGLQEIASLSPEELGALLVSFSLGDTPSARDWLRAQGARYPADCLSTLVPVADLATLERALEDGARVDLPPPPHARTLAELALERGDLAIAARLARAGVRLSEPAASSALSDLLWDRDLARLEVALALGARPSREDIEMLVIGARHHLLRRMAEPDVGLPASTWRPGRYRAYDPGTRQVLREIWAEKKEERKAQRLGDQKMD